MTMTNSLAAIAAKMSDDEARILRRYADGQAVDDIAQALHCRLNEVTAAIARLANTDRRRAQALVDTRREIPLPARPLAPPDVPEPEGQPGDKIADLIDRAVATERPKLVALADRISDLVDQLERDLAVHNRTARLREEHDKLTARLAEIQQELGGKHAVSAKAVRAWAKDNGIEFPTHGRVPAELVARFEKAMGDSRA